jgi:PhnB protein
MPTVKSIPDGYHTVTPFLLVQGADKLIEFVKNAFNAKEAECYTMPDGSIGDSVIMLSEAMGEEYKPTTAGIHLYTEDCDATYQRALEAGAVSTKQPTDEFYGDRSAGVKDKFGNHWWIATHKEDLSKEEIMKRMDDHIKKQTSVQGQQ